MKRAGYIITLMIAFWMVAGGLFFAQSVQAKVVSGSCGGETKYRYDSKSKKLELYGRGVVSQTIRVDKQLSRKNRYFQVKKLVIRQGITAIKDSSVLQYASEEEYRMIMSPAGGLRCGEVWVMQLKNYMWNYRKDSPRLQPTCLVIYR